MSPSDAMGSQLIEERYAAFFRAVCGRAAVSAMRDDDEGFWAISGLRIR